MLGTDYPFPLGEVTGFNNATPGKVIEECSHFDQKLRQKLLFDNGMNFLGLNPQDYMWTFECDWGFVFLFENILVGYAASVTKVGYGNHRSNHPSNHHSNHHSNHRSNHCSNLGYQGS